MAVTATATSAEVAPSARLSRFSPLVALLFGALLPLSLAPIDLWPFGLIACAGLFWLWERLPERSTSLGWWFGVGKYGVGASWIYVSIHDYGNASVPLALGLVALFVAGMALFCLTQGWCYGRLRHHCRHRFANLLLFVAIWVFWEWLLTWVMTGLPWLFLGYGHLSTPLGNLAPIGGVLLVSLGASLSACSLLFVLQVLLQALKAPGGLIRRKTLWLGSGLCLLPWLLGVALGSVSFVELGPTRTAALVQNNVDQNLKWLPGQRQPILQGQEALTEPYWGTDLILWPESAITYFEHQVPTQLARWQRRGEQSGSTLVFGVPVVEPLPGNEYLFYNAVRAVGAGQGRYFKHHLVPFGEYVPLEGLLRGLIDFFDLPMSSSGGGPAIQPLLRLGLDSGAMAICYEIAFPALVARQVRGADGESADVLLTVSNDAWFGTSLGPDQHLQIAQMRAKENARYVLRSTQTGWTAIIDEQGQVLQKLPRFQIGVLAGSYRSIQGLTPYSRWGNLWVLALIVLLALVVVSLRASSRDGQQPI